ncbi:MAG: tetratricopeptide repeat protein [Deltaproteobacteria bacterium]|nr:MAG: tetratricopeptide repeat protein [Deltaproteobacteria bacterium]
MTMFRRWQSWILCSCGALLLWGCSKPVVKKTQPRPRPVVEQRQTPEDIYREALSLHESGKRSGKVDYVRVTQLYSQALKEKPNLLQARYNLAALYEERGEYAQAAGLLADILRVKPRHAAATYRMAQVYFRLRKFSSALEMLKRYITLKPEMKKHPKILMNMAAIMTENGNYENALAKARQCLSQDNKNIEAYRAIARVYLKQKQYKSVHFVYELAEKLKKKDAKLENIRGLAYLGQRKFPLAMLAFGEAVNVDPKLFEAQMNLGALALQYQDKVRAVRSLGAAAKLRPRHRKALLAYAVALRTNKRMKAAESVYKDRLLKMKQNDPAALYNLGVLYVKFMSKPKLGRSYLRRFLGEMGDRAPANHPAHQLIKQAEQSILMQERMKQRMKQRGGPKKPKK